jgi:stress-induced morphogen
MTTATTPPWEAKRTPETRRVDDLLRQHFKEADSYRYNSASIRVRVIDPRFEGMPREKRDAMVEPYLAMLPPETQRGKTQRNTKGSGLVLLTNARIELAVPQFHHSKYI